MRGLRRFKNLSGFIALFPSELGVEDGTQEGYFCRTDAEWADFSAF